MSNGRALFVVAVILATFGTLAVAGGPALDPGANPAATTDDAADAAGTDEADNDQPDEETTGTTEPTETEESSAQAIVDECAAEVPADYADPAGNSSDTVGWVEGYWYSEPLSINGADGLNESELQQVSARAAARFEALRCLTADEGTPPVTVQSREQFRENQSGIFDVSTDRRLADNAALAIRLISETESDSTEEREQNRGSAVGGTYNFITEEIVIVSDDAENLTIDEGVLAHEIGHAIQDQHFDLAQYERNTVDRDKAILGLIEGDVHYIEQQYNQACANGDWDCLTYGADGGDGNSSPPDFANWGLIFQTIQPYNDGPGFIEHLYETGGWDAVNAAYQQPPTTVTEVVRPDRYPDFAPVEMSVPDRSSDKWERYNDSLGPGYDQVGVAGISAMFIAPLFESNGAISVYDRSQLRDDEGNYEFFQPAVEGWRGDRLYTYQGTGNETGAVWQIQFETAADREPFLENYEQLISIRGGENLNNGTYRFAPDSGYDIALQIRTDGETVTIVSAPTVDQLTAVHEPAADEGGSTP